MFKFLQFIQFILSLIQLTGRGKPLPSLVALNYLILHRNLDLLKKGINSNLKGLKIEDLLPLFFFFSLIHYSMFALIVTYHFHIFGIDF